MITRLRASNYRSLGEGLDLQLGRLTALVGPNGSGKSNIADALRFVADCARLPLDFALTARQGFRAVQRQSADRALCVEVAVDVENAFGVGSWGVRISPAGEDGYRIEREHGTWSPMPAELQWALPEQLGGDAEGFHFEHTPEGWTGSPGFVPVALYERSLALPAYADGPLVHLAGELRKLAVYSLFPNTLRSAQSPNPTQPMSASGDNWASTLKALNREEWGAELITALSHLVGDIEDYRVAQAGGFLAPEFLHGSGGAPGTGGWRGAAQESDGTLRLAAILTALFQEPPLSLIGFEEPELAVHPGAIPLLFDFLKEASTRSQILLTTHSPDLLDLLSIDDVRIVERRDGVTTVSCVDDRQRDLVRRRLVSTSDLLHAEGLRAEGAREDA